MLPLRRSDNRENDKEKARDVRVIQKPEEPHDWKGREYHCVESWCEQGRWGADAFVITNKTREGKWEKEEGEQRRKSESWESTLEEEYVFE